MKILLSALFLALSFSSQAISIDQFCAQFNWDREKIECHKAASGKFVDELALDICNGFSFDSEKKSCLNLILNKIYTPGEVKTCRDQTFDSEKVQCLQQLGRRNIPSRNRELEDIKKLTITAQDALRANDLYTVRRALDRIYDISTMPTYPNP
jgi:hypothetical protein